MVILACLSVGEPDEATVKLLVDESETELEILIRKFALQNALLHNGKANPKAVLGKLLSERAELRNRIKQLISQIEGIVNDVNSISEPEIKSELESLAPELVYKKKQPKHVELPDLVGVDAGTQVVMRFAPGPSGPLHIGHTRAVILNDEYVKRYSGKFIIRFEDTNPLNIEPEAYDMIQEDLAWLGVKYHTTFKQSDRFDIYYEWATELIKRGFAYVCTCPVESWRKLKENNKGCPDRELPVNEHLARWEKMLARDYAPGEVSLIVKTDLNHPNPAVRDFVAFRMIAEPHPETGDKYYVYPTYNFSVAIDDHLMDMTHILRGKDHLNNTHRQRYIYEYLDWTIPEFIHYGWVKMPEKNLRDSENIVLKTTTIKEGIRSGKYSGWSDIRLGTLQALAVRGFQPEAFRKYWLELGIKEVDVEFSWDNLYAFNKDLIEDPANRYFFVSKPKKLVVTDVPAQIISKAPLHPNDPERGYRELILQPITGNGDTQKSIILYIEESDLSELKVGVNIRLKDMCNVELTSVDLSSTSRGRYIGNDLGIIKEGAKIIHWVSDQHKIETEVHHPSGEIFKGYSETSVRDSLSKMVQFERFGFVQLDASTEPIIGWFAHK
jgi:glutamyl-tRNA synthetase